MIETPMGKIDIIIDGKKNNYKYSKLTNTHKCFQVDGRYQIIVKNIISMTTIECVLKEINEKSDRNIETGEGLELLSLYYNNNFKISIGVEGEIEGAEYSYLENGIKIGMRNINKDTNLHINIAWITMQCSDMQDIYTWFAADPTF